MNDPFFIYCKQHGGRGCDPQLNSWAKWVKSKAKILRTHINSTLPNLCSSPLLLPTSAATLFIDPRPQLLLFIDKWFKETEDMATNLQHDFVKKQSELQHITLQIPKWKSEINAVDSEIESKSKIIEQHKKNLDNLYDELKNISKYFITTRMQDEEKLHSSNPENVVNIIQQIGPQNIKIKRSKANNFKAILSRFNEDMKLTTAILTSPSKKVKSTLKEAEGVDCCLCDTYSSIFDSIECIKCRKQFHLSCLDPPLMISFPKGYAWLCEECSHTTSVEEEIGEATEIDQTTSKRRKRMTL